MSGNKMMETAIMRRPMFDLRFITETSEYHIVHNTDVSKDNKFMTESVISMRTKNAMEDDSSAFSFVLAGDMEWDSLLNSNDLCILKISPNELTPYSPQTADEVKHDVVMIGLISEVRLEGNYKDDKRLYRITGQSFAKAFMQFELNTMRQVTYPMTGGWLNTTGEDGNAFFNAISQKTIAETAKALIERFIVYMRYNFSDEDTTNIDISTRLRTMITSWSNDEVLTDPTQFLNFEGSFNQLLNEVVIRPFCEKFFEVWVSEEGNEKAQLIIRRTPFDRQDWVRIRRHELYSRDVLSEDVSQSDLDAYSVFNVVAENANLTNQTALVRPKFHPSLVSKYGYKTLEVVHNYLSPYGNRIGEEVDPNAETGTGVATSLIDSYSERLYNWYAMNPNFYSGNIIVAGHPDYRLGNRLLYTDTEKSYIWEYYIESVEHNFSYSDGYTTTLGVTRGLRLRSENDYDIRFNPPQGESQDFKGGYMGEASISDMQQAAQQAGTVNDGSFGGGSSGVRDYGTNRSGISKPADGRVTSPYGYRSDPFTGQRSFHRGLDVAGGGTTIRAMADGKVVTSKYGNSYGRYIKIDHGTLNGVSNVSTLYAHLQTQMVSVGQNVKSGQQIGVMGTTGRSTGVHLHFEVHEGTSSSDHVNPQNWVSY